MKELTIIMLGSQDFNKMVLSEDSKVNDTYVRNLDTDLLYKMLEDFDYLKIYKEDDYSVSRNHLISTKHIIRVTY